MMMAAIYKVDADRNDDDQQILPAVDDDDDKDVEVVIFMKMII